MIREFDIHDGMPYVEDAKNDLLIILQQEKRNGKPIKIVHGYGSTNQGGGAIKRMVHEVLSSWKKAKTIAAYIPGEAFQHPMGFVSDISKYRDTLKSDVDFRTDNYGITFVFFK